MKNEFNDLQIDALKEVSNIGAGNAATALSQMLEKKVDMLVPEVNILSFNEMVEKSGNEEEIVVAVILKVYGDAPGDILFTMNEKEAQYFAKTLLCNFKDVNEEVYLSTFQEIGNILGNSYLNAIGKFTGLNLVTSVPVVATDMFAAILTSTFMDAEQYSDCVLAIDTNFIEDTKEAGANFFFIPTPGSLNKILENIGLK